MLSVIIPARNAATTLDACLESLEAQRHAELEVIVVDDGSTDETAQVLGRWASRLPLRTLACEERRGASHARNLGLDAARGAWVTFVDADDVLPKGAFAALEQSAAHGEVDLVIGTHEKRTSAQSVQNRHGLEAGFDRSVAELEAYVRDYAHEPYRYTLLVHCWGKLFRRGVLESAHLRFDESLEQLEDVHFNFRYLKHSRRVRYVDAPVYVHCIGRPASMSTKSGGEPETVARIAQAYGAVEAFLEGTLGLANADREQLVAQLTFTTAVLWLLRTRRRMRNVPLSELARAIGPIVRDPLIRRCATAYRLMPDDSAIVFAGVYSRSPRLCAGSLVLDEAVRRWQDKLR